MNHADFDPVYMAAMFLDPFLSQLLTPEEESEAVDHLKDRVYLADLRNTPSSSGTSASAGTSTSVSAGCSTSSSAGSSTAAEPGTSTSASAGTMNPATAGASISASDQQEQECGPTLPKRLQLFKFVKMPEKPSETTDRDRSFEVRFQKDVQTVKELYEPLR
jgi:hypothetical protein